METANLPKIGMDKIFKDGFIVSSANPGIFVAILFAVLIYIILEKTSFGYELKACGFNRDAARYAGINEKRSIILSMTIAGAMAGIGGALLYLAGSGKGITVVDVLASEGFLGIPVALLGLNNPIGIIFSGLLIAYLNVGGFNMQLYNFAPQVIEIIIGVIIYFSAFALLVRGFISSLKKRLTPSISIDQNIQQGQAIKGAE
jgi:simple sugar transport system permease protein